MSAATAPTGFPTGFRMGFPVGLHTGVTGFPVGAANAGRALRILGAFWKIGADVQRLRDGSGPSDGPRRIRVRAASGVFIAAAAAGDLYPLSLIYAAKGSAYLQTGEWSWSSVQPEKLAPLALLAAPFAAGPLALLGAAALPAAVLLSASRACFGRFLIGRHPALGRPRIDPGSREEQRRQLELRLGRKVVLDPPAYQGARLAGFVSGLLFFWSVLGGTS